MNAFTTTQTIALTGPAQTLRAGRTIHRGLVALVEAAEAYAALEIATLLSATAFSAIFIAAGFGYSLLR